MFGIARFPRPAVAAFALLLASVPIASAGTVYDAVADFSLSSNPNGTWSYLSAAPGSAPGLMTQTGVTPPGLDYWWDGQPEPDSAVIAKNATGSTVDYLTEILPPYLLNMDPQSEPTSLAGRPRVQACGRSQPFLGARPL